MRRGDGGEGSVELMRPQRQQKLFKGGRRGCSTDSGDVEWRCGMRAQGGSFSAAQAASPSDGIVTVQCNADQQRSMRCGAMRRDAMRRKMQLETALETAASDESGRNAFRHDGKEEAPPKKKVGGIFFGERECERTMVGRKPEQVPWTACDGLKVGKG